MVDLHVVVDTSASIDEIQALRDDLLGRPLVVSVAPVRFIDAGPTIDRLEARVDLARQQRDRANKHLTVLAAVAVWQIVVLASLAFMGAHP